MQIALDADRCSLFYGSHRNRGHRWQIQSDAVKQSPEHFWHTKALRKRPKYTVHSQATKNTSQLLKRFQREVAGGNFNPLQRRNAGAPPTSEIEAQMGTQAFSLCGELPKGKRTERDGSCCERR